MAANLNVHWGISLRQPQPVEIVTFSPSSPTSKNISNNKVVEIFSMMDMRFLSLKLSCFTNPDLLFPHPQNKTYPSHKCLPA